MSLFIEHAIDYACHRWSLLELERSGVTQTTDSRYSGDPFTKKKVVLKGIGGLSFNLEGSPELTLWGCKSELEGTPYPLCTEETEDPLMALGECLRHTIWKLERSLPKLLALYKGIVTSEGSELEWSQEYLDEGYASLGFSMREVGDSFLLEGEGIRIRLSFISDQKWRDKNTYRAEMLDLEMELIEDDIICKDPRDAFELLLGVYEMKLPTTIDRVMSILETGVTA